MKSSIPYLACTVLLSFVTLATGAWAQHRDHGAHVHGEATLHLIADGTALQIEFNSPAINIVGFEHPPRTPEQSRAITEATQQLERPEVLLSLQGSRCALSAAEAVTEGFNNGDHSHSNEHEHGHHGHDHDHDHRGHASFTATYLLVCDSEDSLSGLTLAAFEHYPGIDLMRVEWVLSGRQGAAQLSRTRQALRFN